MSTHNLYFEQKHEKYQNFLSENFHFLVVKLSVYLNRHVFVMYGKNLNFFTKIALHSNCIWSILETKVRKTGSVISTTLIQGFNFTNS